MTLNASTCGVSTTITTVYIHSSITVNFRLS